MQGLNRGDEVSMRKKKVKTEDEFTRFEILARPKTHNKLPKHYLIKEESECKFHPDLKLKNTEKHQGGDTFEARLARYTSRYLDKHRKEKIENKDTEAPFKAGSLIYKKPQAPVPKSYKYLTDNLVNGKREKKIFDILESKKKEYERKARQLKLNMLNEEAKACPFAPKTVSSNRSHVITKLQTEKRFIQQIKDAKLDGDEDEVERLVEDMQDWLSKTQENEGDFLERVEDELRKREKKREIAENEKKQDVPTFKPELIEANKNVKTPSGSFMERMEYDRLNRELKQIYRAKVFGLPLPRGTAAARKTTSTKAGNGKGGGGSSRARSATVKTSRSSSSASAGRGKNSSTAKKSKTNKGSRGSKTARN